MSKPHETGRNSRARFDRMPTAELEDLLRLDFQLPEGEGLNEDTILYITEVIAGREASSSRISCPDAAAAWRELLTRYLPDGTNDLLGDGMGSEPVPSPGQPSPAARRHSRGIRWMIRIAGVAAILAVLFFVTTITAYALGYDVWGTVAKWSSETFSFAARESGERGDTADRQSNNLEFSSLQEALDYFGIEETITPTWIPERFVLESVVAAENGGLIAFNAHYSYGEDILVMYCRMLDAMLSKGQEDENGILFVCFPVTAIAAVLSRSPMTVKRSLNELETAGLIMRVRQGVGEPNRIYVLIPGKEDAALA